MLRSGGHGHDHVRMLLGIYSLGAMPVDEIAPLEAHLAWCRPCLNECEELTRTAVHLGALSDVDVAAVAREAPRCPVTPRRSTSGSEVRSLPRSGRPGAVAERRDHGGR